VSIPLGDLTAEQVKKVLFRARTPDLMAFLRRASDNDRRKLLRMLCPVSADSLERRLSKSAGGDASNLERIADAVRKGDESCLFCEILKGTEPASFVYRDDRLAVFMDLFPVTRGHLLIVPMAHVASMTAVDPDVAAAMMNRAQQLAKAVMQSALACDGYNLFVADGGAADQDIFHAHLHVIPRHHADGFELKYPPGYPIEDKRSVLDGVAETIRFYVRKAGG